MQLEKTVIKLVISSTLLLSKALALSLAVIQLVIAALKALRQASSHLSSLLLAASKSCAANIA